MRIKRQAGEPVTLGLIMSRVTKTPTCWLWTGAKARGYGYIWKGGKAVQVHREVWRLTNGPIPEGLCACHHCDVPACVRPDHLFIGTPKDNTHDAVRKGRWPSKAARAARRAALSDARARCIRAPATALSARAKALEEVRP